MTSTMRRRLFGMRVLLICWLTVCGWATVSVADPSTDKSCEDCHRDSVSRGMGKRYIHMPFLRKQCSPCHVAGQAVTVPTKKDLQTVDSAIPEKIRWFRDSYGVSDTHWVLLPADQVDQSLIFKAWDGGSRSPVRELMLPALEQLPVKTDDGQAPEISNVEVSDVRRSISTSATLAWATDEFADSQVDYGLGTLISSRVDRKLSRRHEVILTGLDANQTYSFQVKSRDLFGHQSQSATLTFSTTKTFIASGSRFDESGGLGSDPKVEPRLFRQGDSYLVEFKADRPISISLGIPSEEKTAAIQPSTQMAEGNTSHPVLKSEIETNIRACDSCHAYLKQSYSHPVNVFPKSGMKVPVEYPLLPDGRISCMSCHSQHGGDFEYRLIKSGKKELCLGCHTDY